MQKTGPLVRMTAIKNFLAVRMLKELLSTKIPKIEAQVVFYSEMQSFIILRQSLPHIKIRQTQMKKIFQIISSILEEDL